MSEINKKLIKAIVILSVLLVIAWIYLIKLYAPLMDRANATAETVVVYSNYPKDYDEYERGYEMGYSDGYDDGYKYGYINGRDEGRNEGYEEGLADGQRE